MPGPGGRRILIDGSRAETGGGFTYLVNVVPELGAQARALTERVGFRQQVTAAPEQVFTLRRELDAATDAVEQWHAQFGFQRMNLPGKRRLAQIHAIGTAGEAAGVGNADKGAQMTKVHAGHDNNFASIEEQ